MKVNEVMTRNVETVTPDQPVSEAAGFMLSADTGSIPVLDNDKLIGVLSIGDLVKETISEQQFTIKQLESYIHS